MSALIWKRSPSCICANDPIFTVTLLQSYAFVLSYICSFLFLLRFLSIEQVSLYFLFVFLVDIAITAHFLGINRLVNVWALCCLPSLVLSPVSMVALVAHAASVVLGIRVRAGCCLFEWTLWRLVGYVTRSRLLLSWFCAILLLWCTFFPVCCSLH